MQGMVLASLGNNSTGYGYADLRGDGEDQREETLELTYRVLATILHVTIFITGLIGNVGVMIVVYKSKKLHTPAYAYLVSLAAADLIVIATAVPEAIAFRNVGERWLLGEAGCAIFVFFNFFGINAGSLSLLAFTVERYIAGCRPLLAQKICTLSRTRKIILLCWLFAFTYCSPWFGLTEVHHEPDSPDLSQCDLKLAPRYYVMLFSADLVLFYLIPLAVAVVSYAKIAHVLRERVRRFSTRKRSSSGLTDHAHRVSIYGGQDDVIGGATTTEETTSTAVAVPQHATAVEFYEDQDTVAQTIFCHRVTFQSEQKQGLRMMVVIVVLFAVAWLPFRGLLLYNTFVAEPWLDMWYLLFAKTLIYLNCAINPFLYNILCRRFRVAVWEVILQKSDKMRWLIKSCTQRGTGV